MTSIIYYLLFAFAWLVSLIPYWLLYRISDGLYYLIYYVVKYRKTTVFHNLRSSFPHKTDEEIHRIARAFYRHFSDFLLEAVKMISISPEKLNNRMKVKNPEVFRDLAERNQNFALVTAHYNNWEMMINLPHHMVHRCMIIYRPLNNKVTDQLSLYMRGRFNNVMVPMENIFREGVKCRSEKRLFSIWFLADQRPPRNSRFWTNFLNHETAFFEGVEKISKKLGMAIVFMDIQKVSRGHYEARLEKLFDNSAETAENEVILTCVRKMEEEIVQRPEFWLWSHKRFKHSRPENTKLITE